MKVTMSQFKLLVATLPSAMVLFSTSLASAQEATDPPPLPAQTGTTVGGHVGLAIPIVNFADPVTAIGADFFQIGLAPGITVKLDEKWAVDFEFVAYSDFSSSTGDVGNFSSLVIDPGVIYNFGFASAGLRAAMRIGGATTQNLGFIPIILKAFPLGSGKVSAFVELDLPVFFGHAGASLTVQPQFGVAF